MVAHLVRLKLRLLRNSLRRSPWQAVATVLALLWGLGTGLLVVLGLALLRTTPPEVAGPVVTIAGSLLVAGWVLVPLLAFGVDETLDPARFVTFAIRRRDLLLGLLLAGTVGVPGVVTALVSLGTVVTWTRGVGPVLVALAAAPLALLTCVAASRAVTTAAAGLLASRRTRELGAGVAVVVLMFAGLAPAVLGRGLRLDRAGLEGAAGVLGWTPLGWTWSAPWDAAAGQGWTALVKLALGGALLAALLVLWSASLERGLVRPASSGRSTVRPGGVLERVGGGRAGAVAVRCLRYWRRDPRYLTAVVATMALPLLLAALVVLEVMGPRTAALLVAPVMAGALSWGLHNDVAYDGSAVWTHVAAAVPGSADRAGRLVALLVWAAPLVVAVAVAGSAVAGSWAMLPAVVGLSLALLGGGAGVSAVSSALLPYPVPDAGSNPFSQPPGSGVRTLVAQLATSTVTVAVSLPTVLAYLLALRAGGGVAAWVALALGLVTALGAVAAGVSYGGRVFDRRGPELLAALRR